MKDLTIENWKELTKFICAMKIQCYTTDEKSKKTIKRYKLSCDWGQDSDGVRYEIYRAVNKILQKIYSLNGRRAFIENILAADSSLNKPNGESEK